ncbi:MULTISPECIES: DoxX family protein [Chryseobacterium]|uniref:DoxX family protein n=1 Tax=Chryseobacterium TaxID=59732 RepID=UPI00195DB4BE|nr:MULTISPECIES: DoxX family protein [Chryseobacterium]MBM7420297.1 putative membrane protein [Chryseobacterium sp. JUb44]MDH6210242.1 putative membrane protein [Chryseobacterium sp. BIGb0186]WSO08955.1 DoxX family protein [Chryseobacterium scophthalmum]
MEKRNKIIYWILTIFLSIGMLAGGIQQALQIGGYNEIITKLHYPLYVLSILGVWKILGVIAILIPKFLLLKEWAYAGFFFAMSGAAISHFAVGQSFTEAVPALILLIVTILSWYFRPSDRKIISKNI